MRVFADAADASLFQRLAKVLRMNPRTCRVSEAGLFGISPLPIIAVNRKIDNFVRFNEVIEFLPSATESRKVCGAITVRSEYVDADEDAGLSVLLAPSTGGGVMVSVAQYEF